MPWPLHSACQHGRHNFAAQPAPAIRTAGLTHRLSEEGGRGARAHGTNDVSAGTSCGRCHCAGWLAEWLEESGSGSHSWHSTWHHHWCIWRTRHTPLLLSTVIPTSRYVSELTPTPTTARSLAIYLHLFRRDCTHTPPHLLRFVSKLFMIGRTREGLRVLHLRCDDRVNEKVGSHSPPPPPQLPPKQRARWTPMRSTTSQRQAQSGTSDTVQPPPSLSLSLLDGHS